MAGIMSGVAQDPRKTNMRKVAAGSVVKAKKGGKGKKFGIGNLKSTKMAEMC